jgi:hypothetical protein
LCSFIFLINPLIAWRRCANRELEFVYYANVLSLNNWWISFMINCSRKSKVKTIFGHILFTSQLNCRLSRHSFPENQRITQRQKSLVKK